MTDIREQGLRVFRELLPGAATAERWRDGKFGDELMEIGIDNVFGRLWGRDGLSRRDRSLVTLGILISLRAEVIYHASGYAGFPAANTARKIAREVFDESH